RSFSLRGRLEARDSVGSQIRILDRWIRVPVPSRPVVKPPLGADEQELGAWSWMELKVDDPGAATPVATRIDAYAKPSWTVKGTVTAVIRDGGRTTMYVDGFPIELDAHTDVEEEAGGLFAELFGELKSDDMIGDDPTYRQIGSRVFLSGSLRPIARVENSFSLASGGEDLFGVGEPSARVEMMSVLPVGAKLFAQAQLRGRYELYRSEDALGDEVSSEPELHLRQLFLSVPSLFDLPVGLTAGKLRVRDHREFLFDEYLDGLRFFAYPFQPVVLEVSFFTPVVPLRDRLEAWQDLLAQVRWFGGEDWRANVYVLRRWDSDVGRGRNVRYYGASLDGEHEFMKLWGNAALLRGEDKRRRQEAYAFDTGLALRARSWPLRPGVSLSFAKGSGERDGDGASQEFRQTGYEDNSSRVWGLTSFRHFGEVLDPELSNIEIATATLGFSTPSQFSLDLAGHKYWLVEPSDKLDQTDLETPDEPLTGESRDLGYGGELVLGLRDFAPGAHFTSKLGVFVPGEAFEDPADAAWVLKLEFRLDF
ncbi:MAG: alginate export family protein, partial [Gemmatimonadota bacterium]|nr:alginate export family protein [Gemmatimonadota bacterium]